MPPGFVGDLVLMLEVLPLVTKFYLHKPDNLLYGASLGVDPLNGLCLGSVPLLLNDGRRGYVDELSTRVGG